MIIPMSTVVLKHSLAVVETALAVDTRNTSRYEKKQPIIYQHQPKSNRDNHVSKIRTGISLLDTHRGHQSINRVDFGEQTINRTAKTIPIDMV